MRFLSPRGTAAALAVMALALPASASAAQDGVLAGAAAADITPPVGTPQFAYTARSYVFSPDPQASADRAVKLVDDPDTAMFAKTFAPSDGIHTRVYARAIVLESGGERFALAMADLGGLPYALTQSVLDRLAKARVGIDGEHLLLSATHTHSSTGPIWPVDNNGYGFVGGDAFDPRIFELTAASIAEAIVGAASDLRPAKVGVGHAELRDASRNREYEVYLRNADVPPDPEEARRNSIDPTVTVVRVDDTQGPSDGGVVELRHARNLLRRRQPPAVRRQHGDDRAHHGGRARQGRRAPRRRRPPVNVWTNGAEGDTSPDGDNRRIGDQPVDYVATDAAKANLAGKRTAAGVLAAWRAAGDDLSSNPGDRRAPHAAAVRRHRVRAPGKQQEPVGPFPVLGSAWSPRSGPASRRPSRPATPPSSARASPTAPPPTASRAPARA